METTRKTRLLPEKLSESRVRPLAPSRALSGLTLATLLITAVSGLFLLAYYSPSLSDARESLAFLHHRVFLGGAVHAVHFWGARVSVVLMLLHAVESGFRRELPVLAWAAGLLLAGAVGIAYLTGHLLSGTHPGFWNFQTTLEHLKAFPGGGWFLHVVLGWEGRVNDVVFSRSLAYHVSALWVVGGILAGFHLVRWFPRLALRGEVAVWRSVVLTLLILAALGTLGVFFPPRVEQPVDFFTPGGQVLLPFAAFVSPFGGMLGRLHHWIILLLIVGVFFLPRFSERQRRMLWTGWVLAILGFLVLGRGLG